MHFTKLWQFICILSITENEWYKNNNFSQFSDHFVFSIFLSKIYTLLCKYVCFIDFIYFCYCQCLMWKYIDVVVEWMKENKRELQKSRKEMRSRVMWRLKRRQEIRCMLACFVNIFVFDLSLLCWKCVVYMFGKDRKVESYRFPIIFKKTNKK